jgi:hypothetical protein
VAASSRDRLGYPESSLGRKGGFAGTKNPGTSGHDSATKVATGPELRDRSGPLAPSLGSRGRLAGLKLEAPGTYLLGLLKPSLVPRGRGAGTKPVVPGAALGRQSGSVDLESLAFKLKDGLSTATGRTGENSFLAPFC